MSYDPHVVLKSVDENVLLVNGFMSICMVAVFVCYFNAIKMAKKHQAYPMPFTAVAWYTVHDFYFAGEWDKWFSGYGHWWLKLWAVSNLIYALMEFYMCWLVFKYGRKELMPSLSQPQFGAVLLAGLVGVAVTWVMIKGIIVDDLCLIAFAVTTFWPQITNTQLITKRQSTRGLSRVMMWSLVFSPVGMFGAWYFLDPYFRSPLWLAFGGVTILWALFNVWLYGQYPQYQEAHARDGSRPGPARKSFAAA